MSTAVQPELCPTPRCVIVFKHEGACAVDYPTVFARCATSTNATPATSVGSILESGPSHPTLDRAIIARLRSQLAAHPKYLAVPVDVADVRAILAAHQAFVSAGVPRSEGHER